MAIMVKLELKDTGDILTPKIEEMESNFTFSMRHLFPSLFPMGEQITLNSRFDKGFTLKG